VVGYVAALRFFYVKTLKRRDMRRIFRIPIPPNNALDCNGLTSVLSIYLSDSPFILREEIKG
jgi:hypothetical protein